MHPRVNITNGSVVAVVIKNFIRKPVSSSFNNNNNYSTGSIRSFRSTTKQTSVINYNCRQMSYFTRDKLNPNLLKAEYAVRGELAMKAEQLKNQIENSPGSLPFDRIVNCNIGNPQQLGQVPITFFRQVLALLEYPNLVSDPKLEAHVSALFPKDAIARAKEIISSCGPLGAYSHSKGLPYVRKQVAQFIKERDGFDANPEHIFLTSGASPAVQMVLSSIIENPNVGVLIPIPQYPLYSASLAIYNGKMVPYYLDESKDWSFSLEEINSSLKKAKEEGIQVRALCFINPGNPTGNCLTAENLQDIIKLCKEEKLVLLADEVYQKNVYMPESRPFISARKVLSEMGAEYRDVPLFSFHSTSKGILGECGRRGGYFECLNVDEAVISELYKLASISLCPNISGQLMVSLMVRPPKAGDESFQSYQSECDAIYQSLRRRAFQLYEAFNELPGFSCQKPQGAMYIFPRIELPPAAVQEAKSLGKNPDDFYCMKLLEATGVCVVPGSGFGQKKGTLHLRSTFLPPESEFPAFISRIKTFHLAFMEKYLSR